MSEQQVVNVEKTTDEANRTVKETLTWRMGEVAGVQIMDIRLE
jgi:hypothetical protein